MYTELEHPNWKVVAAATTTRPDDGPRILKGQLTILVYVVCSTCQVQLM